jgi:ubiquitin-conjugating enzyme E2 Z
MSCPDNIKRIINDIIEFKKNTPDGIYIDIDKTDVTNMKALIIGPKDTPYEDGYFFFTLKFPHNYPESAPSVQMKTIDGKVRLNPNLYKCGKVCLSILGTWSGPGWTSAQTITSVLLSIQTLMNEIPIRNEPGFENTDPTSEKSINFNNYVNFYKYKLAILDVIDNKFPEFDCFKEVIESDFKKKYTKHINNLLSFKEIYDCKIIYESPIYFTPKFNTPYDSLLEYFKKIDTTIVAQTVTS